ncbi:MAG: hypothetical protein LAT68_15385 [Cyclobacteriaceae bacterium]|nr:hypothetical protein [Cyclobacteriaceae bacterium]MCH8517704.1 hypothetical protein [Cyclobacteriaceae bacterium]
MIIRLILCVFLGLLLNLPITVFSQEIDSLADKRINQNIFEKIESDSTFVPNLDSLKIQLSPLELDSTQMDLKRNESDEPVPKRQKRAAEKSKASVARPIADSMEVNKFNVILNESVLINNLALRAGYTSSHIFVSDNRRNLSHFQGFIAGFETYFSANDKVDIVFGSNYRQGGFNHDLYDVRFRTHNVEIPIIASYKLPEFQEMFSLYLGYTTAFALSKSQIGDYPEEPFERPDPYIYGRQDDIQYSLEEHSIFDFGWTWGVKFESGRYYADFRGIHSHIALFNKRSEMYTSLSLTVGYFPFRKK